MSENSECFKIFNYSLHQIFSEQFCFRLPVYQRPYSWNKEQVEQLLSDLYHAFKKWRKDNDTDDYFLGSVVLAKSTNNQQDGNSTDYDIIDGQQRLTTLFLYFIVAYELKVKNIKKYLMQKADEHLRIHNGLRFNVRAIDSEFFRENIAELSEIQGTNDEDDGPNFTITTKIDTLIKKTDDDLLKEIERKFRDNIKVLRDFMTSREDRSEFVTYVLKKVKLIVIATATEDTAFRIFTTLNARGMELSPIDKFKAQMLTRISDDYKNEFGGNWEETERDLGRENFESMFPHLCIYFTCKNGQTNDCVDPFNTLLDMCSAKDVGLATTFAKEFISCAGVYRKICSSFSTDPENHKYYIQLLRRYQYQEWISIAIFIWNYMKSTLYDEKKKILKDTFSALEKVVFLLCVTCENKRRRVKRFTRYLLDLFNHQKKNKEESLASKVVEILAIAKTSKKDSRRASQEEAFTVLFKKGLQEHEHKLEILLRLDSLTPGSSPDAFSARNVTVENIVPANIQASGWGWHHRSLSAQVKKMGNLALLSGKKNGFSSLTFEKKKEFIKASDESYRFITTTSLTNYKEWRREDFQNRHATLLKTFHDYYTPDVTFPTELMERADSTSSTLANSTGTDETTDVKTPPKKQTKKKQSSSGKKSPKRKRVKEESSDDNQQPNKKKKTK